MLNRISIRYIFNNLKGEMDVFFMKLQNNVDYCMLDIIQPFQSYLVQSKEKWYSVLQAVLCEANRKRIYSARVSTSNIAAHATFLMPDSCCLDYSICQYLELL